MNLNPPPPEAALVADSRPAGLLPALLRRAGRSEKSTGWPLRVGRIRVASFLPTGLIGLGWPPAAAWTERARERTRLRDSGATVQGS